MRMNTKEIFSENIPSTIPKILKETLKLNKKLLELKISHLNSELLQYGTFSEDPADFLNKFFSGQLELEAEEESICRKKINQLMCLNQELFQTEMFYRKLYKTN